MDFERRSEKIRRELEDYQYEPYQESIRACKAVGDIGELIKSERGVAKLMEVLSDWKKSFYAFNSTAFAYNLNIPDFRQTKLIELGISDLYAGRDVEFVYEDLNSFYNMDRAWFDAIVRDIIRIARAEGKEYKHKAECEESVMPEFDLCLSRFVKYFEKAGDSVSAVTQEDYARVYKELAFMKKYKELTPDIIKTIEANIVECEDYSNKILNGYLNIIQRTAKEYLNNMEDESQS